jgi:hypothetical protein
MLIVREVFNFITEREGSSCNDGNIAIKRVCVGRYYRYCSKVGYNTYTCTADIEQLDDSNSSKE